ncbi:MAG: hypothetical protein DRP11_03750 [Candidatus Aenigmatarchaeota archaeon]|nr:MAG: hypothetical protein DRP11_03750 [Candidatus Aenigmarchaeota archaeon]
MSSDEIVITLDSKRLIVLGVIVVLGVAATYSYIGALFAFIAPSQDFPLKVTSVATFDTSDASKTAFTRGSTVRIKATVEKATDYYYNYPTYYYYYDFVGDTSYRIIITIMDGSRRPVFFKYTTKTISPGSSQVTSYDYKIPSTASAGTYTIRVMVWSDWLPSGDALAPEAGEKTFEVT